jgi:hypothetical protein
MTEFAALTIEARGQTLILEQYTDGQIMLTFKGIQSTGCISLDLGDLKQIRDWAAARIESAQTA